MLDLTHKPVVEPLVSVMLTKCSHVVFAVVVTVVLLAHNATLQAKEYHLTLSGTDADVVFGQYNQQATSTGSVAFIEGYNTTVNNALTNGASDHFNQVLLSNSVPTVTIGGTGYREFASTINETGSSDVQVLLNHAIFGAASTDRSQRMPNLSFDLPQPRVGGFEGFVCVNKNTGAPEACTGPIGATNVGGATPSVPEPASILLFAVGLAFLVLRLARARVSQK